MENVFCRLPDNYATGLCRHRTYDTENHKIYRKCEIEVNVKIYMYRRYTTKHSTPKWTASVKNIRTWAQ